MRVHRGCPFVRSTRLFSSRINPKTHSETSILKQVFCIHSGMGLRNAVGNRGLRVRPAPVCRLYTLMRPQFMGLCAHAVWVYAPAVYGLMRPCRMGLCVRSLRAYAPIPYGSMRSQFTGLCTHTIRVYAPIPYGSMRPQFTGLCAHAVWVYVSAVYGAACPYFRKLWLHTSRSCICCGGMGFTQLRLLCYRGVYFKRPIYSTQVSRPFAKSVRSCTMTLSGRSGLGL